jgi:hypothetical protein
MCIMITMTWKFPWRKLFGLEGAVGLCAFIYPGLMFLRQRLWCGIS